MTFTCPLFVHPLELSDPREGETVHLPWIYCEPMPCGDPTHYGVILDVKRDESALGRTTLVAISVTGQAPGLPIRDEAFTTYWSGR